jgi:hypothetical protein
MSIFEGRRMQSRFTRAVAGGACHFRPWLGAWHQDMSSLDMSVAKVQVALRWRWAYPTGGRM